MVCNWFTLPHCPCSGLGIKRGNAKRSFGADVTLNFTHSGLLTRCSDGSSIFHSFVYLSVSAGERAHPLCHNLYWAYLGEQQLPEAEVIKLSFWFNHIISFKR